MMFDHYLFCVVWLGSFIEKKLELSLFVRFPVRASANEGLSHKSSPALLYLIILRNPESCLIFHITIY